VSLRALLAAAPTAAHIAAALANAASTAAVGSTGLALANAPSPLAAARVAEPLAAAKSPWSELSCAARRPPPAPKPLAAAAAPRATAEYRSQLAVPLHVCRQVLVPLAAGLAE